MTQRRNRKVDDPPDGDQRLILWAKHAAENTRMEAELARIALEAGGDLPTNPTAAPNDPVRLRGIPAVGGRGSVGGAIAGSRPGDSLTGRRGEEILRAIRRRAASSGSAPLVAGDDSATESACEEPPQELDELA